ncbi:hypothetical protein GCM10009651_20490 [Microbacterium natoriense]|uniref:SIR2 family protein n=1 Tax=Microbacterium natoriense TaxID=284570 RepID=UPI0031CE235C
MPGISPLVSLATSMHAQPGVYSLLLGSGVSTGAGLPTGWGVVKQLVARVAALADGDTAVADARADPEAWWAQHGDGDLKYTTLLETLAPTPAARQGLLAGFFEGEDALGDRISPSRAHHAIAQLVARGSVRVILTTNFDRLMEQALEAIGISPQVIARPEAVNGMAPLAHAPVTIIKLHGDYKDLGTRNTPAELATYPAEWVQLLERVFDEYGLVVSGWSADWDTALVEALEASPSRRYPLYWDERSGRGETAKRVLANRMGTTVPSESADDLFESLVENLEGLDKLSAPPLTTALAVARLKKYLPDPVRRIDLHDLVMSAVDEVAAALSDLIEIERIDWAELDALYAERFTLVEKLSALVAEGVWHDTDGTHDQLWLDALSRIIDVAKPSESAMARPTFVARRLPALALFAVVGITAMRRGREDMFIKFATAVQGWGVVRNRQAFTAAHFVHYWRIAEEEWVNGLPRWEGRTFQFPVSQLLSSSIRPWFRDRVPDDTEFTRIFYDWEYRWAILVVITQGYRGLPGGFIAEWSWFADALNAEVRFRDWREHTGDEAWKLFFDVHSLTVEDGLLRVRTELERFRVG